MSGIYTITCLVNNKIYVGQATNIRQRRNNHLSQLRRGIHYNPYLQRAWNKYGEKNFKIEVLVECPKELLSSEEHYWVYWLNTRNKKYGYNQQATYPNKSYVTKREIKDSDIADYLEDKPKRLSENTKAKLSRVLKEKIKNEGFWVSAEKSKEIGRKISAYYKERGYRFTEEQKIAFSKLYSGSKNGSNNLFNERLMPVHKNHKEVYQFDLDGNFIKKWKSLAEASISLKILRPNICKVLKGLRRSAGGFIWSYDNTVQ